MKNFMRFVVGALLVFSLGGFVGVLKSNATTLCMSDVSFERAPIVVKLSWIGIYLGIKYKSSCSE